MPERLTDLWINFRDEFLVSTDTALRQQLSEFEDHRLIVKKRQSDGNEYIWLTVKNEVVIYIFYLQESKNIKIF